MDTGSIYRAEEFVVLKAKWFGDELCLMRNDMKVLIAEGPIRHLAFNSSLFLLEGGKASKLCFVLLEVIYFRSFDSIIFNIAH